VPIHYDYSKLTDDPESKFAIFSGEEMRSAIANTIAIVLFEGAEEMDFVGPWEVFTAAVDGLTGERVMTVAETLRPVVCEKGMRVLADAIYEDARGVAVVINSRRRPQTSARSWFLPSIRARTRVLRAETWGSISPRCCSKPFAAWGAKSDVC
jgi:transcriptional regulator GlxA family with amidase domain